MPGLRHRITLVFVRLRFLLVDAFTGLLTGVRATGSVFGRSTLTGTWSLDFVDGAPLTLCTVLAGNGWIVPDIGAPVNLSAGESLVVRGPAPFRFVDAPETAAAPVACGELCVDGRSGTTYRRGWDDHEATVDDASSTTLVVGAYPLRGHVNRRLLDALPPVLKARPDGAASTVQAYIAAELRGEAFGQQVVLDRLLDWMLVSSLRDWFDSPTPTAPRWFSAVHDPVVGPALRALHDEPQAPWTVARLAAQSGTSRSTFAQRFTELVGEPPMSYLTEWRMTVAADLLMAPSMMTVAEVARRVGYSDEHAFTTAFKRVRGQTPSQHRRAAATDPGLPAVTR